MIIRKSKAEIERMRRAGIIAGLVIGRLAQSARPGVTTGELDALARDLLAAEGAVAAFKGYRGFPAHICSSVNDQVVHGLPGKRRLQEGDILSLDLGVLVQGYCGDVALTVAVGEVGGSVWELLRVTRRALYCGIEAAQPGRHLSDVSNAIQVQADAAGLGVVRNYVGHGIGRTVHEDPQIPNYGPPGKGPILKPGMTLAIEPMFNLGGDETKALGDGWTVVTADGKPSAHFEHTVLVGENGPEILTLLAEDIVLPSIH